MYVSKWVGEKPHKDFEARYIDTVLEVRQSGGQEFLH